MRAFVDPDLCIGCTQCAGICPAVFTMEGALAVALVGRITARKCPPPWMPPRPAPSAPSAWRRAESSPKITGKQLPPGDFLWAGFVLYYKM